MRPIVSDQRIPVDLGATGDPAIAQYGRNGREQVPTVEARRQNLGAPIHPQDPHLARAPGDQRQQPIVRSDVPIPVGLDSKCRTLTTDSGIDHTEIQGTGRHVPYQCEQEIGG